jgi:hypothetical protein
MNQIVVDDAFRGKLHGLPARSEFRDPAGNVLGYFLSPESFYVMLDALEKSRQTDRAERERISKEQGGRSLKAILADLH